MHDPATVAFEIPSYEVRERFRFLPHLATIWHVDPEKDGSDDSCGWFMRERHGSKETLEKIVRAFEFDWDRVFTTGSAEDSDYDPDEPRPQKTYFCGWFKPDGDTNLSVQGIVLQMFFRAAQVHFGSDGRTSWKKAKRWLNRHLLDIMLFAENNVDSLVDSVTRKFAKGCNEKYGKREREEWIRGLAGVVYAWILRSERPWWQHPRWHIWHWKIQVHPLQRLKRWLFSRCCKCGKGFSWGYAPVTNSWHGTGPLWFRSEQDVYHHDCSGGGFGGGQVSRRKDAAS